MTSRMRFPVELYVTRHGKPGDSDSYFNAHETLDDIGVDAPNDPHDVAVYQLVTVGQLIVSRRLATPPEVPQ